MRECGMLLPVASLPSKYGIGAFSKEAYGFIDTLKKAGQHYWQILPLGPTSYGDSPYQSFSAFAGNPYFINLDRLVEEGLLTEAECTAADFGDNPRKIDFGKLYLNRFPLLRRAYGRWRRRGIRRQRPKEDFGLRPWSTAFIWRLRTDMRAGPGHCGIRISVSGSRRPWRRFSMNWRMRPAFTRSSR